MAGANSVGAVCGADGIAAVDNTRVARLTNWSVNPTSSVSEWGDSDSAGFTCVKAARKALSGTLTVKLDSNQKPHKSLFMPGDTVELVLWEDATSDYWYIGRAVITSYTVTFDQDTKEVVECSADFSSDGQYYRPGETGIPSEAFPSS